MDDTQRIVKCGNLLLHSPGGFFKKRWHNKYLVLYDGSKSGVKRLELFDSEIKFKKQNAARIIPLVDCVRVVTCQRHKSTFTFEVRTSDQFYLLAAHSFQDMNDWVNCLRLVAFGPQSSAPDRRAAPPAGGQPTSRPPPPATTTTTAPVDVLLERRLLQPNSAAGGAGQLVAAAMSRGGGGAPPVKATPGELQHQRPAAHADQTRATQAALTASQAAAAAASALAKTRQRQPSLLGSCKPQPPDDSPFLGRPAGGSAAASSAQLLNSMGQIDTLTPAVRGQLISAAKLATAAGARQVAAGAKQPPAVPAALDEEEENMLYCSIEDNPSEHNYRVKVIETELALRCQLKCYQLTAPTTISEQYEELAQLRRRVASGPAAVAASAAAVDRLPEIVTFYQLIIGPQELTLLNDYTGAQRQRQGLWSWPYQCIRRYGFDKDNCFMFEAGRKCGSGPGQFVVQTPKAYNIYQDVVKFVNELRTVAPGPGQPAAPAGVEPSGGQPARPRQVAITQIPVVWTPSEQPAPAGQAPRPPPQDQAEGRATTTTTTTTTMTTTSQFFDALRQLDTSATNQQQVARPESAAKTDQHHQPISSSSTLTSHDSSLDGRRSPSSPNSPSSSSSFSSSSSSSSAGAAAARQQAAAGASGARPIQLADNQSRATQSGAPTGRAAAAAKTASGGGHSSEQETDESGYEQGDESVDSCSARTRFRGLSSLSVDSLSCQSLAGNNKNNRAKQSGSSSSSSSWSASSEAASSRGGIGRLGGRAVVAISGSVDDTRLAAPATHASRGENPQASPQNNSQQAGRQTNSIRHELNSLIADGVLNMEGQRPGDFEANLIRDVYSEITKLHAKFALTTNGSADDSMSSRGSSLDGCGSSTKGDEEGADADDERAVHGDLVEQLASARKEPMYSNVLDGGQELRDSARIRPTSGAAKNRELFRLDGIANGANNDHDDDNHHQLKFNNNHRRTTKPQYLQQAELFEQPARLQQPSYRQQANSYLEQQQQQLMVTPPRPLYGIPAMLNPIPECPEGGQLNGNLTPPTKQQRFAGQQRQQIGPPLAPKPVAKQPDSGRSGASTTGPCRADQDLLFQTLDEQNLPGGLPRARLSNSRDEVKKRSTATTGSQKFSRLTDVKLKPTNHYVINDVQYAKISRSLNVNL